MKSKQQEEAKELYFQTNLTKAEIAGKVGVSRKTLVFWSQQGNWDKIKMSACNMPSLVAEKCYYLIDQYMSSLLIDGNVSTFSTLQLRHAQTIHLLASTIKKLKNRSTVNESMEMFNFFLDGLNRKDPALAEQVAPQIEEYIANRKNTDTTDFLMEEFRPDGTLPYPDKEIQERWADEKDNTELRNDFEYFLKTRSGNDPAPNNTTEPQQPKDTADVSRSSDTQLNEAA